MATVDAWGGSWADTWLLHWTYDDTVVVVPPGPGGAGGAAQRRGQRRPSGRWYDYPNIIDDGPNPFRPEPIKEPEPLPEPETVMREQERQRVEGPTSLTDLGRQPYRLRGTPTPIAEPEKKLLPGLVKAKAPRTKTPGVDVLDAKPEASLEDRIEGAIERGMTKALSQLQAKPEKEPEDEEERELRLLRQLGFLN